MKIFLISIILLLSTNLPLFGQEGIKLDGQPLPILEQMLQHTPNESLFGPIHLPLLRKATVSTKNSKTISITSQAMPLVYAYKDLALFCKLEVQLEKVVKLPVKFRLGSVDYVDWLEGKRDSY